MVYLKSTGLREEWDLFKKTWVDNKKRASIICKEDREDFYNFDNFICSEIWATDEWSSQINTIITFRDKIGRIKVFAETKIIRICYSPFKIMSQKTYNKGNNKKTGVVFLLQDVIDKLIECLLKSNPNIKIQHCTRFTEEYNTYMEG